MLLFDESNRSPDLFAFWSLAMLAFMLFVIFCLFQSILCDPDKINRLVSTALEYGHLGIFVAFVKRRHYCFRHLNISPAKTSS